MNIRQFQEIASLKQDATSLDYKIQAVAVLTGKTVDEVESLPIDEFQKLAAKVSTSKISDKLLFTTKVGGIKFEAILNIRKLTTSEFIELSTFTKDEQAIIKNLHKIMAIFYKPKSKWFGLKKVTMSRSEVAELFLDKMDVNIAYPLAVFFLKSWIKFTPIMQTYLEKKMKEVLREMRKITKEKK